MESLKDLFERAAETAVPVYGPAERFMVLQRGAGDQQEVIDLEKFGDAPRRVRSTPIFTDVGSFRAYLADHANDRSRVYFDRKGARLVAIIDDCSQDAPAWRDHRPMLQLTATAPWLKWTGISARMLDQGEFAEFIEEHGIDIIEPSHARMLEIATSLQIARTGAFKSAIRLSSGEHSFNLTEDHATKLGVESVQVPERIKLSLAPYEGTDPFKVDALFRYRLNDGALQMGIRLLRVDDILTEVQNEIAIEIGTIRDDLRTTVLFGSP